MSGARKVVLTMGEARASDGALCWRPKRSGWFPGLACSREFGHPGIVSECRHDMQIRARR